jgi:hypothetical protein
LLQVTKLENGQLDVAPPRVGKGAPEAAVASLPPRRDAEALPRGEAASEGGEAEPREGRSRRGRRGGRGRKRGDRVEGTVTPVTAEHPSTAITAEHPVPELSVPAAVPEPTIERHEVRAPVAEPVRSRPASTAAPRDSRPAAASDGAIGVSGIRLTRDEAFSLVRDAVDALVSVDDAVPGERVRQKAFALLGRDSESLSERNFARILRDAHDADVVDLRKRGDAFEVAAAATAPSVADQLQVKEAALKTAADQVRAANTPAVPRGMGPRSAPARGGRGHVKASPPANLFLVGVVDDAPEAEEGKPKRVRKPRARKAPSDT